MDALAGHRCARRTRGTGLLALILLSALLTSGCARKTRCSLGEARLVTREAVASYEGAALVTTAMGALALWSNQLGLFSRSLSSRGAATRLGEPCPGGIAALAWKDIIHVACLRPADGEQATGALTLFSHDPRARTTASRQLTNLGRDARDVALAAWNDTLYVVFGDGEVGKPRVQLIAFDLAKRSAPPPVALSAPEQNGREPAIIIDQGVPIVVFVASELRSKGAHDRLMIARGTQSGVPLHDVLSTSPRPTLARAGDGFVLAFRDLPRPKVRSMLYVARLDAKQGKLPGGAHSIGRANSQGGPNLALCERTRVAIVPLDHAGELYIAFNPLNARLETPEMNHQYYENEKEFVANASVCLNGYPLTLIAERTEANHPQARLLAAEFRCTE